MKMATEWIEKNGIRVIHVTSTDSPIRERGDALDLMFGCGAGVDGARADLAVDESCFHPDFFRLKSGVAGEILQMFVNYRRRMAIIGDFSKFPSDNLRAFIAECNRGRHIFFVPGLEAAFECFGRV